MLLLWLEEIGKPLIRAVYMNYPKRRKTAFRHKCGLTAERLLTTG
jgi:hypothetical protein